MDCLHDVGNSQREGVSGKPLEVGRPDGGCADCALATKRRHHGFTAGCRNCCARAAGRSPQFQAVRKAGVLDRAYRALLAQFGLEHAEVRDAAAADRANQP